MLCCLTDLPCPPLLEVLPASDYKSYRTNILSFHYSLFITEVKEKCLPLRHYLLLLLNLKHKEETLEEQRFVEKRFLLN